MSEISLTQPFIEIKCPCCGRHIDKFKVNSALYLVRKCKSCKNNIVTDVNQTGNVRNYIDAKENSRDVISPNRHRNPKG